MTNQNRQRYADLVARFSRARIVVAGDLIADEFLYGRVERVSREAPVLILKYDTTEIVPGGAIVWADPDDPDLQRQTLRSDPLGSPEHGSRTGRARPAGQAFRRRQRRHRNAS